MRYYVLEPQGEIENIKQREGPRPTIANPNDVLVRVKATTLNYKDLALAWGWLPLNNAGADYIPLSDGSGEVFEVGADVTEFAPGDRVVAAFFPEWQDGAPTGNELALGRELPGMLSEFVCLPSHALVKIPPSLTFEQAATFPCAGVTAWNALCETAKLKATDTVLTMGTGGVSVFAIQIAKAKGARVIATTGSAEKESFLKKLGADHVVNYRKTGDWDKTVIDLTDGRGADVIVEVGGAQTFQKSLNAAAFGGRISCVGVLAGVEGHADPTSITFKSLSVRGVYVGSTTMLRQCFKFFHTHGIVPSLDSAQFSFDAPAEAYSHLARQAHTGKVVIRYL
ncbi:MAG: NAD(P)-dependent alcohol dehydrogenase [Pseudomonadota bacterium]